MYSTFFENNFLCMGNWALQGQAFLLWQIYQIMTVVLPNLQYGISICKKGTHHFHHSLFIQNYVRTYTSSAHTYRKQITVKTWLFLYLCMLFYLLTNVKHALTKGYELKIADIMTFTVVCEENELESLWPIPHW